VEDTSLGEFWALVKDVWTNGLYGIDVGQIITAVGIFIFFLFIRNLFTRLVLNRIRKWVGKTENTVDDAVVEAIEPPIRFIPVVMGIFFATSYLELDEQSTEFVLALNRSLVAFVIFWALYRASGPISSLLQKADRVLTGPMIQWLAKAIRIAFALVGAATILEIWGIQVGPLVAGLGLFGVAVALGAQDLFKNLIAGLFVIGEKRFHPGDWILVKGVVEGTVEQIGFRTTTIRRFDKAPVYVPNSALSDNAVINFSRMTYRRIKWLIGLKYDSSSESLDQVRSGIESYLEKTEAFARPEEASTFVRIDRFSDSSIDILLYCFTTTTDWLEWLEIKEQLLIEIKRLVSDAGTDFAFPSSSIYIEAMPEEMDNISLKR